jgi:hypothetical protein
MEGPVSWQALLLIVSSTIVVNATTALFVGWLVYRGCVIVAGLEKRITRLEMLQESGAPGAPRGGRG